MQLIWIASLLFAVVIALFAVQNTTPISVSFLFWRLEEVAVAALVLAAAALGALLTYLLGLGRGIRSGMDRRNSRATIRRQEAEIAELQARVRDLEDQAGLTEPGETERAPARPEVLQTGAVDASGPPPSGPPPSGPSPSAPGSSVEPPPSRPSRPA
jgi:lipopolysaccharide assembly protein A